VGYPGDDGRVVLSEIDLEVPGGTSLALVGPTGCGKTTLLRLLLRFIEPKEGRVLVDGTDVSTVTLASLRSRIATVFEETTLFSDTVAANIAFGRPGATDDEIVRAAELAQAHRFVTELPHGYETVVGEQGYTLSGGQRQRLAVARAILMDPAILLLDDATSAVDPEVESEIRRGLAHAMEGRTTLVVARRMATAALADRVVYLEAGQIVAQGSHREVWATVPAYREALSGAAAAAVGS
jgi:ATP-binding cassette subfamily B protein